jgi:peptidoglycan DL-endopeptidase LytE
MIGKCRAAIIFASIAVMLGSLCGYAKETSRSIKANPKQKRTGNEKAKSIPSSSYIVRRGDTLKRIASNHATTIEALKLANHLKSDIIQIGQELKVPVSAKKSAAKIADPKVEKARLTPEILSILKAHEQTATQTENPEEQPLQLRVVEAGFQFLGVRYHRSGESEKSGFDCSGLVKTLFSKFNIELPRTSREQYQQGEKIDRDNLKAGDLVFFSSKGNNPTHVGIYIGDNKFIHAALKAKQVIVSDLSKIWYSMRYLGARRVIWGGDEPAPEAPKNQ